MRTSVIVIGAGHAGLAASACLAERSIDHVVLERGEVANAWATQRWDSLRLLTPNWQSRLPGYDYRGRHPDGFRSMPETVDFIRGYARAIDAPVRTYTEVRSARAVRGGFQVETTSGGWHCRAMVLASGACNLPNVPALSSGVPAGVTQLTPFDYRHPELLDAGGVLVVGASATGMQLAEEIAASGREVTISAGEHIRVPRTYRGRDIQWWMDAAGVLDQRYDEVDDINRARRVPSLQLVGGDGRMLDLNALLDKGVRVTGKLVGLKGGTAWFSGSLRNACELSDLKMNRLLDSIDAWARESGVEAQVAPPERYPRTRLDGPPLLSLDLSRSGIRTIVWATGFRPEYTWLHVPVLDPRGRIRHDGGVADWPGLYAMGLPFMRRRKSALIDGAGDDARFVISHLAAFLDGSGSVRRAAAA